MTEKKRRGNPALYKGMKSLNPLGRKAGTKNKYALLARELMTEKGPDLVHKVIDKAMDDNSKLQGLCMKMCMDRILPVHKAIDPNRTKSDSKVVINVGASSSIEDKIANTDPAELANLKAKSEEEVIIEVGEVINED